MKVKASILALLVLAVGGCGESRTNDEWNEYADTVEGQLSSLRKAYLEQTHRLNRLAADSAKHANVDMSKWPWMTARCDSVSFQFHCDRCDRLAADSARCANMEISVLAAIRITRDSRRWQVARLRELLLEHGIRDQRDVDFINATDTTGVVTGLIPASHVDDTTRRGE